MKQLLLGATLGATILPGSWAQAATQTASSAVQLEEVIVTAARREESAQDVAGGLQVFGGAELERAGANQLADYLLTVPGVSFRDQGASARRVSLRGISNFAGSDIGIGVSTSTVGMYLNDISVVNTSNVPDLAIYDLQRIEVLKGPQGTLYGEGAMGGAIKMILKSPDLTKSEGRAETTLSNTQGGGFNYQVRGVLNLPLAADRLGLRLVGSYQDRDGFVENLATGAKDVNGSDGYSARGTLLWQTTDALSFELLALYNAENQDYSDRVDSRLADLLINQPEVQFTDVENNILGLTIKYDLGFADFSSISSYYSSTTDRQNRLVVFGVVFSRFGTITQQYFDLDNDLSSVSQELRLVSKGDGRLNWVAGAFYRDKKQESLVKFRVAPQDAPSVNAGLGAAGFPLLPSDGTMNQSKSEDTYEQYAVYGEANFALTQKLKLTAGLRWFDETVGFSSNAVAYGPLAASVNPHSAGETSEDGLIPKVALSYDLSDAHLIYAQAAQGFRSGIVNIGAFGDPTLADSDSLWNYELGSKNSFSNDRVRINGSVFYVDWKDVQTLLTEEVIPGVTSAQYTNGGDAELIGAELELVGQATESLMVGLNAAYTYGEMVRAVADQIEGSKLPNIPEWTASAFVEYRKPVSLVADATSFARFDVQYSDRQATRPITTTSDGAYIESYSLGKLQVGLETGRWSTALFVDNLWNERAQFGRGNLTTAGALQEPYLYQIARPRTYGIRASASF